MGCRVHLWGTCALVGYGVIGSPTDSGSVSSGSSPGTPAVPSSSGLGRRPLKPVTGVRIPSGLPRTPIPAGRIWAWPGRPPAAGPGSQGSQAGEALAGADHRHRELLTRAASHPLDRPRDADRGDHPTAAVAYRGGDTRHARLAFGHAVGPAPAPDLRQGLAGEAAAG